MFGSATENLNLPLQVYGEQDETIIFASGSLSNILFESTTKVFVPAPASTIKGVAVPVLS